MTLTPMAYGNDDFMLESASQSSNVSAHSNSLVSGLVDTVTLDAGK